MVEQHRSTSIMIFLTTMVLGGSLLLSAHVQEGLFTWWTLRLTQLSAAALHALGFSVRWNGQVLSATSGSAVLLIGNGCNGAWAHLIFLASVLAYPAAWKEKLLGLAVGEPLLLVLNLVRIVSLFMVGVYAPTMLRAAHVYVWQFLIIGFAMLLLFIWADQVVERPA
jgi:exosortase H (IPTLxxWG-CTERM-specific)